MARSTKDKDESIGAIQAQLATFVGDGPGSVQQVAEIEAAVVGAKLSASDIKARLIPSVTAGGTGLTGDRATRVRALLTRLAN